MEEELLDRASRRADQAEVFRVSSRSTPVSFEANRLKSIETRDSSRRGHPHPEGAAAWACPPPPATPNRRACSPGRWRRCRTAPWPPWSCRARSSTPASPCTTRPTADLPVEVMVELGRELVDRMQQKWTDVQWDCRVSRMVATHRLINSRGCSAEYTSSSFSVSIEGTLVQDTDMLFVHDGPEAVRPHHRHLLPGADPGPAPGVGQGACSRPHRRRAGHLHAAGRGGRPPRAAAGGVQRQGHPAGRVAPGGQAGGGDGRPLRQHLGRPPRCRTSPAAACATTRASPAGAFP